MSSLPTSLIVRMHRSLGASLRKGRLTDEDAIAYVVYIDAIAHDETLLRGLVTIGTTEGLFLDVDSEIRDEETARADEARIEALRATIRDSK